MKIVELRTHHVLVTEPGIDGYWAPDGRRLIYSNTGDSAGVSIREITTGKIVRYVASPQLGDYYSWGVRDGADVILTINGRYYTLDADTAVPPVRAVPACPGIGAGDRPLLSKDGRRITTFVRGTIVVRDLADCENILDTQIAGAKADFSWDGRYIAFHALRPSGSGYDIQVIDLGRRTVRTVTDLPGSSFFPSWTRDGRLCFRYDGPEYHGFMIADNVLAARESPLPREGRHEPLTRTWEMLFPESPQPPGALSVVLVWGAWSAHSPDALLSLQKTAEIVKATRLQVSIAMATDPGSSENDVARMLARYHISIPRMALDRDRLWLTEENNQNPTTLLFENGLLRDRRMGAQSVAALIDWISSECRGKCPLSSMSPFGTR